MPSARLVARLRRTPPQQDCRASPSTFLATATPSLGSVEFNELPKPLVTERRRSRSEESGGRSPTILLGRSAAKPCDEPGRRCSPMIGVVQVFGLRIIIMLSFQHVFMNQLLQGIDNIRTWLSTLSSPAPPPMLQALDR